MEKVIVKRLIRHFPNSFVKIAAKFFRAEIKKKIFSPRRGDATKKRKIVFQVGFGKP